jgi:S1-C subfamily serine protease
MRCAMVVLGFIIGVSPALAKEPFVNPFGDTNTLTQKLHVRHTLTLPSSPELLYGTDSYGKVLRADLIVNGRCRSAIFYHNVAPSNSPGNWRYPTTPLYQYDHCTMPDGLSVANVPMPRKVNTVTKMSKTDVFQRYADAVILVTVEWDQTITAENIQALPKDMQEEAKRRIATGEKPKVHQGASGSAVAVGENDFLTNCHVVHLEINAPQITLTNRAGSSTTGDVIDAHPDIDICVLHGGSHIPSTEESASQRQIDILDCLLKNESCEPQYHYGSPDITATPVQGIRLYYDLKVGETVYTIGHPAPGKPGSMQLTWSFSDGTITALRDDTHFKDNMEFDVIQHNALMTHGNSGGALFDEYGNLIGLTEGAFSEETPGYNIAVPADLVWILYGKYDQR